MEILCAYDAEDYPRDSLLQHIKVGNNNEVLSMLQNVANPCQLRDCFSVTLLHVAATWGNVWLLTHLLRLGANVDAPNCLQETPLMFAIKNQQLKSVEVLLAVNADIFVLDTSGRCALGRTFISTCSKDIARMILYRVTIERLNQSEHVGKEHFHVNCPLYNFMSLKNFEVIKILLEKGSPVDARNPDTGETSLHMAVERMDLETIKLLLKHGANANLKKRSGDSPLTLLKDFGDQGKVLSIFNMLMAAGANLIDRDRREISVKQVLLHGNKEIIRSMLKYQFDLHFEDKHGHLPLHYLAQNKNPDVLVEFSGFDMNVNIRTKKEWYTTPLHLAATCGNSSSVQFLVERGAEVNARCYSGGSPLRRLFGEYNDLENRLDEYARCVEILLVHGTDLRKVRLPNFRRAWHFRNRKRYFIPRILLLIPVMTHLSALQATGHKIEEIEKIMSIPSYKDVFDLKKVELEDMKQIQLGKSVTLLDFLVASHEMVCEYARYRKLTTTSLSSLKMDSFDPHYQKRLHESFRKFTKFTDLRKRAATALDKIFIEFYNISVYNVAQKIVFYVEDSHLYKLAGAAS